MPVFSTPFNRKWDHPFSISSEIHKENQNYPKSESFKVTLARTSKLLYSSFLYFHLQSSLLSCLCQSVHTDRWAQNFPLQCLEAKYLSKTSNENHNVFINNYHDVNKKSKFNTFIQIQIIRIRPRAIVLTTFRLNPPLLIQNTADWKLSVHLKESKSLYDCKSLWLQ